MIGPQFANRHDAGKRLAARLRAYAHDPRVIVLGLPRGGVPVAAEVAAELGAPLDVFVVRKLGVPGLEETAMGAVASGGITVLLSAVIDQFGVSQFDVAHVIERERAEVDRREAAYRGSRRFPTLGGRIVIVVDDGVATGATMHAAVSALRSRGPMTVVAAAPVMSREAYDALQTVAHERAVVSVPPQFIGVGLHYADFAQTSDDEVREELAKADARRTHAATRPRLGIS